MGLAFKACPVVAVEIDVQRAQGHGAAQAVAQQGGQAAGQIRAAALNAHQHDLVALGVAFQHLRGQAVQNAGYFLRIQQGDDGHASSEYASYTTPFLPQRKAPVALQGPGAPPLRPCHGRAARLPD